MTDEELGKLFRRFSQANSDVHCQMGGSGLGLYIAKQLCELQGGRIEATSVPGQGATFRFFIQAWSVKQADAMGILDRPSSVPPKLPSMAILPVIPLHILVCDDNIINRKTLVRQLKQHKHKVVMAEDGQEALVSRCWTPPIRLLMVLSRTSSLLARKLAPRSIVSFWMSTCQSSTGWVLHADFE